MTLVEEIVDTYTQRKRAAGAVYARMMAVRDAYNGDVVVPLPELDRSEQSMVANLVAVGIDQQAMRIASVMPDVFYPPLKPGEKRSEDYARVRRLANLSWWKMNRLGLKKRRQARHLISYAMTPEVILPDVDRRIPRWEVREPLGCYPAPTSDPDDLCPDDVIFATRRTLAWVRARFPDAVAKLRLPPNPRPDHLLDVLEYLDADERVLAVVGATRDAEQLWLPSGGAYMPGAPQTELARIPVRIGMCPAVVAGRITLDRPQGQFDGILGMYQNQAKLMALEYIAVKKGIFPDTWLVGRQNETPRIIKVANGLTGQVGEVKGGELMPQKLDPGFMTNPTIDRYERYQRVTAGIPAEFGGESPGNVRTGRRGDAVMSAVVDFPVQESQELLAAQDEEANRRAVATVKAYWGSRSFSFYVPGKGANTNVDYVPNKHFENDNNVVSYAHAGSDANSLVIGLGQRIGTGELSKRGAMEIDPMITDPELEHDRIVAEGIEQALLQSLEQQATAGTLPPADLARIMELVRTNKVELAEAVQRAHDEAQKRQAANPTPPGPDQAVSPDQMPGLAAPGMGAETAAVPAPEPSVANLGNLLSSLRKPVRTTPGERQAVPA